jgi:undecaprenyl-phosphate 4-deoxy-4-formamido-L-arabinose transferase
MILKTKQPYISVVVPVFQSCETLKELHKRLVDVLKKIYPLYEIVYVDDGSPDDSWKILETLYKKNKHIKIIQLTQNYGQHNAIMCGFANTNGQLVVTLDDDLQNPPEEITKLVVKIHEGYDVVYGEYKYKQHSLFRNFGSALIQFLYKFIFKVSGNLTSFRIIKKEIIDGLLEYNRNYTFIDGLLAWQTKNIGYVEVEHKIRVFGKSGYNLKKLIQLSLNMMTNFSIFPLQLASITGFILSFLGLGMAVFFIIKKLFFGIPVTGFASIIVSITIFSGAQLVTIGMIGEYIGRIHLNLNNQPQYRIRKIFEKD